MQMLPALAAVGCGERVSFPDDVENWGVVEIGDDQSGEADVKLPDMQVTDGGYRAQ